MLLTYTNTSSIKDVSPLTEITVWALMPNDKYTARSYLQKGLHISRTLHIMGNPLIRHCHKISLHGQTKSFLVLGRLDDGWLRLACQHTHRLAHALHLLDNIVLSQVIDDTHHNLVFVLIEAHKNRVVDHIDNGQKQCIIHDSLLKEDLGTVLEWERLALREFHEVIIKQNLSTGLRRDHVTLFALLTALDDCIVKCVNFIE
jgi:hypothetical protein